MGLVSFMRIMLEVMLLIYIEHHFFCIIFLVSIFYYYLHDSNMFKFFLYHINLNYINLYIYKEL